MATYERYERVGAEVPHTAALAALQLEHQAADVDGPAWSALERVALDGRTGDLRALAAAIDDAVDLLRARQAEAPAPTTGG